MKNIFCFGLIALSLSACAGIGHSSKVNLNGACDKKFDYDINFNRFDETAQQIAHATGCFIETDTSITGSVKPNSVKGHFSPREAVVLAVKGTSLKIVKQEDNLIEVVMN